ncbi:MAG: alpha/beta hydrolase [Bacteroidota bacterium]
MLKGRFTTRDCDALVISKEEMWNEHGFSPWPLVKRYCDRLQAPYKEFIVFDESGHSPLFEEPENFNREIRRIYDFVQDERFSKYQER